MSIFGRNINEIFVNAEGKAFEQNHFFAKAFNFGMIKTRANLCPITVGQPWSIVVWANTNGLTGLHSHFGIKQTSADLGITNGISWLSYITDANLNSNTNTQNEWLAFNNNYLNVYANNNMAQDRVATFYSNMRIFECNGGNSCTATLNNKTYANGTYTMNLSYPFKEIIIASASRFGGNVLPRNVGKVIIYNRSLSAGERVYLYNNGTGNNPSNMSGVVGLYTFQYGFEIIDLSVAQDGSDLGIAIRDESGNRNHLIPYSPVAGTLEEQKNILTSTYIKSYW